MSQLPSDLRYTEAHQWAKKEADGGIRVGITDFAQAELGDLVYVELPAPGTIVTAGKPYAIVESVKAASDVYSPVSGAVTAVNEALVSAPELINQDAWSAWLFIVAPTDGEAIEKLLDAEAYKLYLKNN